MKLVSQRNEVSLLSARDTVVSAAVKPPKKKLKMTRKHPIDSAPTFPADFFYSSFITGTITINYYTYFHLNL
jgi:hypothetical protein